MPVSSKSARRRDDEVAALKLGLDLGMMLIDAAEMYWRWPSREVRGRSHRRLPRRDVHRQQGAVAKFLARRHHRRLRAKPQAPRHRAPRPFFLHWPGHYKLKDTLAGFQTLMHEGLIKAWGMSHFDVADMEELAALAGGNAVATNQVLYNLARRGIEADLLRWCRTRHVPIMAYSPVEQGRLTDHTLARVAARHGATAAQVALAWLLEQEDLMVIPKATTHAHERENRAAVDLTLTQDDLAELESAFPPPRGASPLEILLRTPGGFTSVIMASYNFAVECGKRQVRCESRRPHEDAGGLELDALDLSFGRHPVRGGRHHLVETVGGFAEMWPSVGVFVFYVCSAAAVILALRRLELSVAYAIWSGVGTALTAMIDFAYFREPLTLIKLASLTLVVLGVVGSSLASRTVD
jgi:diketogulonate reductase-like aldo/keto reductase/multidrug transporter EmrE-like cation transporter